jgi:imidazolonepropionase-like amidohydrolase
MKNKLAVLVLFSPVFVCSIASAQTHVAVHAGHVLDVKSGKLLADQTVVIEDGKIVSSGATADAKVPADAIRIDIPNATVLPGLIDAHTHLTSDPKFGAII